MLRHALILFLLSFSLLIYSPAQGEMSIGMSSSLDTLNYDLDNIHLKLEKLNASWSLSPSGDGKLFVEHLRARRLLITLRSDSKKSAGSELPNQIKPPFPLKIQDAEISEVIVVTSTDSHIFTNVQFNLEADNKTLKLNMMHADTPWGKAGVALNISTSKPFVLVGKCSLKQTGHSMPYDVVTSLSGDLEALHFKSSAILAMQDGQLSILQSDSGNNSIPSAHLNVDGKFGLIDDYPITFHTRITELRPELLGNYPAAKLNFDLNLQGNLGSKDGSKPVMQMHFSTWDSTWKNQVLSSVGNISFEGAHIRNIDFRADMANNSIKANGSLGEAGSHLDWSMDLPNLASIGAGFSGEAHASGVLEGTLESFALRFNLMAQKLLLPGDLTAEKLDGKVALMSGVNGGFDADLRAIGLQRKKGSMIDASMVVRGTRANHQVQLSAQGRNGIQEEELKFQSTLQGGLISDHWQGAIQSLVYKGLTPIMLEAPAKMSFNRSGIVIEGADFQLLNGRVFIDLFNIGPEGFSSKGNLAEVTLNDLPLGMLSLPSRLQGSPVFSGKWNVIADKTLNGSISLWRETGDFELIDIDGIKSPLGLQEVKSDLKFHDNDVDFTAHVAGQYIGGFDVHLATTLTPEESGFSLMANAPFYLSGTAQLKSLAWLPLPISLNDAIADGELSAIVQGNGTIIKPNLKGSVIAKNLKLILPSRGITLTEGRFDASFENDQLSITQASWKAGEGYLHSSGSMTIENNQPKLDLDWAADNFTAISGSDRLLILNGSGKTTLVKDMLAISGDFKVVRGLIELADEDTPALGDDVIVLGDNESLVEPGLKVLLNSLRIDLGDDFTLHGRGIDAQLYGAITMSGLTQYSPHSEGSIKVKKGTFMVYGQVLNIERGILNFAGPLDNPGLSIRAMRNSKLVSAGADITGSISPPVNAGEGVPGTSTSSTVSSVSSAGSDTKTVSAGVEITGSAFQPRIKLVSDPNVPDSDKLSWLMLGHGMDKAGKNEFGLLSLAAGALLTQGQSVPLQTQIAHAAGLDEINVSGVDAASASLTFGKRLSSKLYLSYEKSFNGLLDVARLTFNITPRWALQAETGTESAVDALYTFSFK